MRPAQSLDVFVAVAGQAHANLILAITRKCVRQQHPATRAHRQAFDMLLLREVCRQAKRESIRATQRRAHGEAAYLLRGGEVAVEQTRRERIDGDVVKAVALLVLRQQSVGIDLHAQQIADGVLIFRTGQPTKRRQASRGRLALGKAIERLGQARHDIDILRLAWPTLPLGRRHLPGRQPPDNALPFRSVLGDLRVQQAFQIQLALGRVGIVTVETVPLEKRHGRLLRCRNRNDQAKPSDKTNDSHFSKTTAGQPTNHHSD